MRQPMFTLRHAPILVVALLVLAGLTTGVGAQTQERKPVLPATPVADADSPPPEDSASGVSGASWQGPNWGVRVSWDPAVWSVEAEFIDAGYDGVQIGTPASTAYLEAYPGFGGDAGACLADAERELGEREGVTEVVPLPDRPMPVPEGERGEAGLFGVTATLPDGNIYRGIEYIECRTVVPGEVVLEITWQAGVQAVNQDFPHVERLFAAIEIPDASGPAATPAPPGATPVA